MDDTHDRMLDPEPHPDDRLDLALRPHHLKDVIGQDQLKENLRILIEAAKQRNEAMDHVLFYWSSWLGENNNLPMFSLKR